jgi:hypothetical protein
MLAPDSKSGVLSHVAEDRCFWDRREGGADRLNAKSWSIVSRPDCSSGQYAEALELAIKACEVEGPSGVDYADYLNTLGVAQFRCGTYSAALTTLIRSDEMHGGQEPADIAFLAMTQERLGLTRDSRASLDRLERIRESARAGSQGRNAWDDPFLREAQAQILDSRVPADPFAR